MSHANTVNELFTIAQMGEESIESILSISKEEQFSNYLRKLAKSYQDVMYRCKNILNRAGKEEKGLNGFEKVRTDFMINMQSLNDDSTSHLAEMMMNGTVMGIIKTVRLLNHEENKEIKTLEKELLNIEETSLESLKQFL